METNNNIQNKIDSTFDAIDAIENVNVSPFFKDKTMQRLFAEEKEVTTVWSWLTPKLQLATLACVVILNVVAFSQLKTTTYNDDMSQFAETYGLSVSDDTSVLN
ncbi:MAG: hypothetical protein ABJL44_02440 [Algibacter sp.]